MSGRQRSAARGLVRVVALGVALALAAGCGLLRRGGERPPLRQVSPPVAFEVLRDSPDLPILDLRPSEEFHGPLGHLMGAINVPVEDFAAGGTGAHGELLRLLRPRTFLVYCAASCPRETMQLLRDRGFDDAMHLWGGIEAWLGEGYGTVGAGAPADHVDEPRGPKSGTHDAW